MATRRRTLTLSKGEHRYIFRYAEGREADLLETFTALARSDDANFDWLDAAVLSYQLGKRLQRKRRALNA